MRLLISGHWSPMLAGRASKMEIGTARYCIDTQLSLLPSNSAMLDEDSIHRLPCKVLSCSKRTNFQKLAHYYGSFGKNAISQVSWRTCSVPVGLEESSSIHSDELPNDEENASEDSAEELLVQSLSSKELKFLLADSERAKLLNKLSEANQQNRFLKRQLQAKEDVLINFKSELAMMELETQALVTLAEEISQSGIPVGSRKINGKYIQSHLLLRLEAMHEKLKGQIEGVEAAESKEVALFWCGMAESVQVMGSFDGWSQGKHLSQEYDGSFSKFSTTLMLRTGRYEIKFLVDGVWQLSPEYPTVGEGPMENNLLVVE